MVPPGPWSEVHGHPLCLVFWDAWDMRSPREGAHGGTWWRTGYAEGVRPLIPSSRGKATMKTQILNKYDLKSQSR